MAAGFALVYGVMYLTNGRNLWAPIVAHSAYDVSRIVLAYYLLSGAASPVN